MRILDLTLPTAAENLALDEALLEEAECAARARETLRLWEPQQKMIVVGRSSRVEAEVRREVCRELGIPILRRISGGAAIVAGPGCLMYSLVLSYQYYPGLRAVSQAHTFVLGTLAQALNSILPSPFGKGAEGEGNAFFEVRCRGTSDLAVGEQKFSGNSMRCRHNNFLYHGTILYNFPLELISRCLKIPPRMPDYRNRRDHDRFVKNLSIPLQSIKKALISAWNTDVPCDDWPRELTTLLANEKYNRPEWNGV